MRRDDELARGGEAEAAADVVEATGDGQRGGGEDDGVVVVEECGGEELGDVDGRGLQVGVEGGVSCSSGEVADASSGATLDPEDGVAVGGLEEEGEMGADVCGAFSQAGRLFHVLQVVEFAFEAGERVEDAGVVVAALFEEGFAVVEGHAACSAGQPCRLRGQDREEHARAVFEGGAGAFDR